MTELIIAILFFALKIYRWILVVRIIIEVIASFSRDFRPPKWFSQISEVFFVLTDPPVKALRRLIPSLRMGNVALDVSVLVLFFALYFVEIMLVGLL